jgi:RNA recognition motif-containing protein
MNHKIVVENLPIRFDQMGLYSLFSLYGEITEIRLIADHISGLSRGFAFITFKDPADARKAIDALHGKNLNGKTLEVNWAIHRLASMPGIHADDPSKNDYSLPFPILELTDWVKKNRHWDHQMWLQLLRQLRDSGHQALVDSYDGPQRIGQFLESLKNS